jgi:hypothetical protein
MRALIRAPLLLTSADMSRGGARMREHSYLEVLAGQLYQLTKKIWEENKIIYV